LERLFELLRGGKVSDAQEELEEANQFEKYLWLMGSDPMFDNVESTQESSFGDLLPNSVEK
jgi:hypothetical protein